MPTGLSPARLLGAWALLAAARGEHVVELLEEARSLEDDTSLLQRPRHPSRKHWLAPPDAPLTEQQELTMKEVWMQMNFFPANCHGPEPNATARVERNKLCRLERDRIPSIYSGIFNRPSSEIDLSDLEKAHLEHGVARKLMVSDVVVETSREFGKRLFDFVVAGGKAYNNETESEAIVAAFTPKCSVENTGFAGNDPATIKAVLTVNGNVREIWCYMYCLSKNEAWLDNVLSQADESFLAAVFGQAAGARAFQAISERKVLVEETKLLPPSMRYTYGVPDYLFPPSNSWVDFNFQAELPPSAGGGVLWQGSRSYVGCQQVNFTTADPKILPPLSQREIDAECEGKSPPCKLHWMPGESCYDTPEGSIYYNHTELNGYRRVAGPSGTTSNALQLALSLGFSSQDLLAFRTTAMAWLLLSNDHSFIEVMLAAEPYMEESRVQMQWGRGFLECRYADFQKIWPKGYTLHTSWGPTFHGAGDFMP